MGRNKVLVTRRRAPDLITLLKARFDVETWDETIPPPKSILLQRAAEYHGILTEIDDIVDKYMLRAGTALRVFPNRAVGVDNIDD